MTRVERCHKGTRGAGMDKTDPKIIVSEPQRISPDALASHAAAEPPSSKVRANAGHGSDISGRMTALTIGALGVVFGDIGTSPLYAMHNTVVATTGALP